ncbi:alpha-ribazole phosphatase [Parabacteroides sp. PF5-5]|uniref:alpha-ribazole phosphatase n=1 Tax=unclassified Parabacteroides TaxID=2649774 RepID=UPI0024747733|nr:MULTISPECIES: alpha-ribazole phosphatase [unclassified Parabacteroides]MDH6306616.1 alpha-ribazole phosphatase [Parabacteroides sp. PH5-39]MDH6317583.1 alpha-ribazole phosphatase [Parabacteroides sp. PF5-13]MDH6321327.1 alpha-ribazole phosphatase [Parabacteroides sp. PH5-13]MDH6325108.1 alpha-ribazole phosphatase [Parabacteroides sp. PH5-8]MDH6328817.1 alpha-ribazole phosphatase [Parabacteroides sp. PH5-41]
MDIYMIRHTAVDVPPGYTYGQSDVGLKDTFAQEAEIVKQQLAGLSFDRIWCSPLTRCVRLATYCGYPDAEHDDRIKELNFGEWEMKSWQEVNEDPRAKPWFADWRNIPAPGGESFSDQYNRVANFLDEIRAGGYDKVCVFAHGGVLTNARVYAGEYPAEEAFYKIPAYGEIIKLTF